MSNYFKEFFTNYYPHAELKKCENLGPLSRDDIESMEYVHLIICPLLEKHHTVAIWQSYYTNKDYLISGYFEDVKDKVPYIDVDKNYDKNILNLMQSCIEDFAKMTLIVVPIQVDNKAEVIYLYINDSMIDKGSFIKIYWKNSQGKMMHANIMPDFMDDLKHIVRIIHSNNANLDENDVYQSLANVYDKVILYL